jgi:hypothetical protein
MLADKQDIVSSTHRLSRPEERSSSSHQFLESGTRAPDIRVIEAEELQLQQEADRVLARGFLPYTPSHVQTQTSVAFEFLSNTLLLKPSVSFSQATTFVALVNDEQGRETIAGTVRLFLGCSSSDAKGLPIIPAMDLVGASPQWPHRQKGIDDTQIGEVGRFTIVKGYRQSTLTLGQALLHAAFKKAREHDLQAIYAITTEQIWRLCRKANFSFEEVREAYHLQTEQALAFWAALPGYWQKSPHCYLLYL